MPAELAASWRTAYRRAAFRALRQQAVLARIGRILDDAGAGWAALKGGAIVWAGGGDPALRPMRDLDVLVPPERAAELYEALRRNGFAGPDPAAPAGAAPRKHLPELIHAGTGISVELHTRLIDILGGMARGREVALRAAMLAAGRREEGGGIVLAPADLLLHLILHAAIDHQFNNGPLLLLDIARLIAGGIDWPSFWRHAALADAVRACQLVLRIAECQGGQHGIDWCGRRPDGLDERTIRAAALLMVTGSIRSGPAEWLGWIWGARPGGEWGRLIALARRRLDPGPHACDAAGSPAGDASIRRSLRERAAHLARRLRVLRWLRAG